MGPRVKRYLLADALSANSSHFLPPSFFVRPEKPVSSSRPTSSQGRRAQGRSRLARDERPPEGLGLDGAEHAATLECVGMPAIEQYVCRLMIRRLLFVRLPRDKIVLNA